MNKNCSKVISQICQIPNKPLKYCQIFLNFCQSGKISSNLVTLIMLFPRYNSVAFFRCFCDLKLLCTGSATKELYEEDDKDIISKINRFN